MYYFIFIKKMASHTGNDAALAAYEKMKAIMPDIPGDYHFAGKDDHLPDIDTKMLINLAKYAHLAMKGLMAVAETNGDPRCYLFARWLEVLFTTTHARHIVLDRAPEVADEQIPEDLALANHFIHHLIQHWYSERLKIGGGVTMRTCSNLGGRPQVIRTPFTDRMPCPNWDEWDKKLLQTSGYLS